MFALDYKDYQNANNEFDISEVEEIMMDLYFKNELEIEWFCSLMSLKHKSERLTWKISEAFEEIQEKFKIMSKNRYSKQKNTDLRKAIFEIYQKLYEYDKTLFQYNSKKEKSLDDILDFHYHFERIHPFQDVNGRVGRLIMFKECLANKIIPFVITDDLKYFYYRGLSQWEFVREYLRDTCLTAQDNYKKVLEYFKVNKTTKDKLSIP